MLIVQNFRYDLNSLYQHGDQRDFSADLGAQYTYDLLSKNQLQHQEMIKIFDYCYEKAITPFCTPLGYNEP